MGSSPSVEDQKKNLRHNNNINKPPYRNVQNGQNGRQRVIQRNANNRQLIQPIPRPLQVHGGLPIGNYVVVRVPVYYAPQALYYVQQSPIAPQVYVSPSNIYTPVAVSQLPQIHVPQVVVPQVPVPHVAVAQRPNQVIRVPVVPQEPQVSILRVEIPQVGSEVGQEPKVMVPQPPVAKNDDINEKKKTPIIDNRESDLISESLSNESSEEEESTSSDYSSDSDDYVIKDEYPKQESPKPTQLNDQSDLQWNDDLAYAFQLEDVLNHPPYAFQPQNNTFEEDLSTWDPVTPSTHKMYPSPKIQIPSSDSFASKNLEEPLAIDEILHLYREGEPVGDHIDIYIALNPKEADQLNELLEHEVSGQSILQNVQQYYKERDPLLSVEDEFTIDYLTPSDDDEENWSYEE
jgi:hypothetical protein